MEVVKNYTVETDTAFFDIVISKEKDSNIYVAKYYGSEPKMAKIMNPGDELPIQREVGSGTLQGSNMDQLIEDCHKEIEENHGKVIAIR